MKLTIIISSAMAAALEDGKVRNGSIKAAEAAFGVTQQGYTNSKELNKISI
ncbi:MAG: hypothetical protein U9R26_05075 [Campylobacterota bacterium]|nr:hypothetical protein [Campylobacterota bacterium]